MGYGAGWVGRDKFARPGAVGDSNVMRAPRAQPNADGMAEPELLRMGRDKLLSPSDGTRSADGMGRDWNIGTDMNGMYPLRGLSRLVGAYGTLIGVPGIPGLRCAPTRAIQSHPYRAEIEGLGTRLETSDGTL